MKNTKEVIKACKVAFPYTIPILTGFLFLGFAYGVYMNSQGFSPIYPVMMSMLIYAGSMEFITASLLLGVFNPLGAFFLTLMVNARHLFYGISMLDKFRDIGIKKIYLIFGLCDEAFSINYTTSIPDEVDKGWFMFFVTLFNQIYWVGGATLGALFGSLIKFNLEGIEFVLTALLVVIFIDNWLKEDKHYGSIIGILISFLSLIIFGADIFIVPAMIFIIGILLLFRKSFEGKVN